MNNLYKTFEMDSRSEKEGVWLTFGPMDEAEDSPVMRLRIARSGGSNLQFTKRREVLLKPYRHQIQNDIPLPEEVASRILRQLYAETIVLEWENIPNRDGQKRPFNVEQVMEVFEDLPQWFATVRNYADNIELFRKELREADVKN